MDIKKFWLNKLHMLGLSQYGAGTRYARVNKKWLLEVMDSVEKETLNKLSKT